MISCSARRPFVGTRWGRQIVQGAEASAPHPTVRSRPFAFESFFLKQSRVTDVVGTKTERGIGAIARQQSGHAGVLRLRWHLPAKRSPFLKCEQAKQNVILLQPPELLCWPQRELWSGRFAGITQRGGLGVESLCSLVTLCVRPLDNSRVERLSHQGGEMGAYFDTWLARTHGRGNRRRRDRTDQVCTIDRCNVGEEVAHKSGL